ncbi:RBBP9/YdeN family alpha/beta hydrolase [Neobacillus drentensis]|uniref:RBBP9/YdeN family alpha/beta hydrolase n=1 Tax=Neobacillus drentensis TaxID=220684 RepID=UPI0028551ED1|nr:alpha/beta hydrolase [Neobacillus drentensis]MDR7239928.1 putative alpha/beta hydrolase family esterase [Neobacillus drentensis]
MNQNSFLIIHGLGGSGADHWQTWLANELEQRNHHVCYPTFSNFDSPIKKVWLEELSASMKAIPEENNLTVITHSLGCILWLHYISSQNKQIAKRVILVAPPSPSIILSEAKSFYPVPLVGNHLKRTAEEILFVHSSNDPYCSMDDIKNYINLGHPSVTISNAGHINPKSGHGKWPWILDLSLSPKEINQYI